MSPTLQSPCSSRVLHASFCLCVCCHVFALPAGEHREPLESCSGCCHATLCGLSEGAHPGHLPTRLGCVVSCSAWHNVGTGARRGGGVFGVSAGRFCSFLDSFVTPSAQNSCRNWYCALVCNATLCGLSEGAHPGHLPTWDGGVVIHCFACVRGGHKPQ